jgi:hypothetical protein
MIKTFNYVKNSGGINGQTCYPYEGVDSTCKFNRLASVANCTGYVRIASGNETALQVAVATIGPISVAIDAAHKSFQLYKSGIYDEPACNSTRLNHAGDFS